MQLIIAEKPDLGKAIAAAIPGKENFDKRSQLIYKELHGEPVTICWCFGHMLTIWDPEDYDLKYKQWKMEDIPFYFKDWKHKIKPDDPKRGSVKERVDQIGELLKEADSVIHAGDIDDEGQLLIDELLEWHHYKGPVYRLNTNDTSEAALRKALDHMDDNDDHTQAGVAAFGRQLCDKVFGYNLTRYYTLLNGTTLPVGRVKMPTLGLVVQRDRIIENHKKTFFYTLDASLRIGDKTIPSHFTPAKDDSHLVDGRILDKSYLKGIGDQLKGRGVPDITVSKKTVKSAPPLPFNQTKLYLYCESKFGLSPDKVKKITQELREKRKAITYNRSDCQYLGTATFEEAPVTLPQICKNMGLSASDFDTSIKSRCFNDANITAHTAIIPTNTEQNLDDFSPDERKVYESIAKFYLIQFLPPCQKEVTSLTAPSLNGGTLNATSTVITDPGYLSYFKGETISDDEGDDGKDEKSPLSDMAPGKYNGQVMDTKLLEKETHPPARYTQATLIEDMASIAKYCENEAVKKLLLKKDEGKKDEHGSIGTPATRDSIISELVERGYLRSEKKGKKEYLISTDVGREFYDILPDSVRKVDVSAKWWYEQELIKEGKLTPDGMAQDVMKTITAIIQSGEGRMENAGQYSQGIVNDTVLGQCPKCGGKVYETKDGYKCVSPNCKFKIYKDNKFFAAIGKTLPPKAISIMLSKKKITVKNCKSKRTGKTFDAVILCDFSEDYPKFSFAQDDELDEVGKCPKCGGKVIEKGPVFACTGDGCKFAIWKSNKYLESFGKTLSAGNVKDLLSTGKTKLHGCKSKKNPGKTFDCILKADFSGTYPDLSIEFENKKK